MTFTCFRMRRSTSSDGSSFPRAAATITGLIFLSSSDAFVPCKDMPRTLSSSPRTMEHRTLLMSSMGDSNSGSWGRDDYDDDNPLNKWMRGEDQDESTYADNRLPISYGAMNFDEDEDITSSSEIGQFGPLSTNTTSPSGLARSTSSENKPARVNPYLNVVSRLTPSDLISRFTATASPRVQDAVRTTILGLIGGLPQMAFETKTVATGERLASLMFQLQMTGYMFKNAEYRMSLSQSLESQSRLLPSDSKREWRDGVAGVKGKIKVRYGGASQYSDMSDEEVSNITATAMDREVSSLKSPGLEVEVDAETYMTELRTEVARLRDELEEKKLEREEEIRKDLLLYIRTLPPKELKELTGTMSPEVLDAMKGLVTAVLAGIGDENEEGSGAGIGPNTVTEQSGESLAELCMWQLVVGFNLRELEVREEFKSSLNGALGDGTVADDKAGNQFGPGAFE